MKRKIRPTRVISQLKRLWFEHIAGTYLAAFLLVIVISLIVLTILLGRYLLWQSTQPRWYTIEAGSSVTIDDIVIDYSVSEGSPGVPQTWSDEDKNPYHNIIVNETEGTEDIGAYLYSSPDKHQEYTLDLEHDSKRRTLLIRVRENFVDVALINK